MPSYTVKLTFKDGSTSTMRVEALDEAWALLQAIREDAVWQAQDALQGSGRRELNDRDQVVAARVLGEVSTTTPTEGETHV